MFNPMLGETYELVTEDFRFFAEQVSHHPPVSAFCQEGKQYKVNGHLDIKSNFGLGNGTGCMNIRTLGYIDYYYENFDEHISVDRPVCYVSNMLFGNCHVDFYGEVRVTNHKTGEYGIIHFKARDWRTESRLSGKFYDQTGQERYEIYGPFKEKLELKNLATGEVETIFEKPEPYPGWRRQFGFSHVTMNLNYICPEMREWIAPTDSRLRYDMRLYEEGLVDEADEEKIRLEVKQRKARKIREESKQQWVPNFFVQREHPVISGETAYQFIQHNNYWDRREHHDWQDLPDLWL